MDSENTEPRSNDIQLIICTLSPSLPCGKRVERVERIELSSSAWEADALPLCYTRV